MGSNGAGFVDSNHKSGPFFQFDPVWNLEVQHFRNLPRRATQGTSTQPPQPKTSPPSVWFYGAPHLTCPPHTGDGGVPGDINASGSVTSADIIFLVGYVFKGGETPPSLAIADVNADCVITSSDIILLVNFVFKGGNVPLIGCA